MPESGDVDKFFLNQFLLQKDLRGKFQLPRLHKIAQFRAYLFADSNGDF
jgi:hypothetical protein